MSRALRHWPLIAYGGAGLLLLGAMSCVSMEAAPRSRTPLAVLEPTVPDVGARQPDSPPDSTVPARPVFREWTTEATVVDALGRIGKAAVPALVDLLHDGDRRLRDHAAQALARMGADAKQAVPDLLSALREEKDEGVRKRIIRALGQIGPAASAAVPALVEELKNSH